MSAPTNRSLARPTDDAPHVDSAQLLSVLAEISRIGARTGAGITRTGLGPEEAQARAYLAERYRREGLAARTDPAGNLIVRRREADPAKPVLLLGSHVDTVVHGGRLDGTYGVVAACEVVRVLARQGMESAYEPVAVAFSNEEGARFPYPFFGSLGLTGQLDIACATTMTDRDGTALSTALRAAGGDLDMIEAAAWPDGSIAGYLELHIEQGPVLEDRNIPIGVVEAITGRTIIDITVQGVQGHAGTTPMSLRRDALVAAAQVVLAVQRLATTRGLCAVSTVGCLDGEPNVTNVIPGMVRLTAEIRDGRAERLRAAERALVAELSALGSATGTRIDMDLRPVTRPTQTDHRLREAVATAADDLGLTHLEMFSGAGHDAQIVARSAPIGMVFVPSRGGISHAPQEHTDDDLLVAGADTLLHAALRLVTERW
ncbi:N-carbamoyl-L-amino-acid hydrolase [Kibdelosporangium banguiense]|uniref:N-carbamoyl-L-amino-acid hydrolase n=1 Tax=Kibdelosporangium banguiense TaxID=1365924 RepID=A0ABS4TX09_9PSEU|nr:Zn-dependent hydrolase [Kibdelosporangium banguiense]MBP2328524.1 N-carbamoyl-L-amino-acid hydrolase [Kibdelosporangium banguiense]